MIWVFLAILAEKSVGRPTASSNELVCKDWVPPRTAERHSRVVRMILLYGSWRVRLQPEVWQWVLSIRDSDFLGSNRRIMSAHRKRAALSMAISMKKFIPIPKKKERRGAKSSISRPAASAAFTYSRPSAIVKAVCRTEFAPASIM